MAKAEYLEFMRSVIGICPDPLGKDEVTTASKQEIGWWKKFQIERAIHHARYGRPTPVEIHLLSSHNVPISRWARRRSKSGE